jgi:hypothetical protein
MLVAVAVAVAVAVVPLACVIANVPNVMRIVELIAPP